MIFDQQQEIVNRVLQALSEGLKVVLSAGNSSHIAYQNRLAELMQVKSSIMHDPKTWMGETVLTKWSIDLLMLVPSKSFKVVLTAALVLHPAYLTTHSN
jgi:hypothetical protein